MSLSVMILCVLLVLTVMINENIVNKLFHKCSLMQHPSEQLLDQHSLSLNNPGLLAAKFNLILLHVSEAFIHMPAQPTITVTCL